jgi:hypothetical protein
MSHTSNNACYVAKTASNATITFNLHALGCSICNDSIGDALAT